MGFSSMTALPLNRNVELVSRSKKWTRTDCKFTKRLARPVVHAVNFLDAKAVHHTVFTHLAPTTATFFSGLENYYNGTVKIAGL